MSCLHPIPIIYDKEERKIIRFNCTFEDLYNKKSCALNFPFDCISRFEEKKIDCGHCLGCSLNESRNWVLRILMEQFYQFEYVNKRKPLPWCFLTLTYDDEHLPRLEDGRSTLNYDDLRGFFQKVKDVYDYYDLTDPITKELGKKPWRFYYAPGEYGEEKGRPHYHAVVVGLDFFELDRKLKSNQMTAKLKRKFGENPECKCCFVSKRQEHFNTPLLDECWDKGFATVSVPGVGAICYTTGYIDKKRLIGCRLSDYYQGRASERAIMTQKIGRNYFEMFYKDIMSLPYVYFDGKHYPIPRYFKKRTEIIDPEFYETVRKRSEEYINTPEFQLAHSRERLEAKEVIMMQRYLNKIKPYENMTGKDIFGSSFFKKMNVE